MILSSAFQRLLITCMFWLLLPLNANASIDDAFNFVKNVSDKSILIINDKQDSFDNKQDKLKDIFTKSVDTYWIAKFVLGRHWRKVDDSQRERYLELHKKFLVTSYVPKFKEYNNHVIIFKKSSVSDPDEEEYLVETEIISKNSSPIHVNYKVRKYGNKGYKIFDIIAEGVSLIATQRSEFNSILSRNDIHYLLDKLESKISN